MAKPPSRSGGCCLFFGLGGLALGRCPSGCAISGGLCCRGGFLAGGRPKKWLLSFRSGWFGPRKPLSQQGVPSVVASAAGVVSWLVAAKVVAVVSSSVWVVWPSVIVPVGVPSVVASAVGVVSWLVAAEVVAVVSSSVWVVWPSVVVPLVCHQWWPLLLGWFPGWWQPKWWLLSLLRSGWFGPRVPFGYHLPGKPPWCAISGGLCCRVTTATGWPPPARWQPKWWLLSLLQSGWFGPRSLSQWVCHQPGGPAVGSGFLADGGRSGGCCLFFGLGDNSHHFGHHPRKPPRECHH